VSIDLAVLLPVLVNVTILVAAIVAGGRWLRRWMRQQITEPLRTVQAEVSPNQGASMFDTVNRIEYKLDAVVVRYEDHLVLGHGATIRPADHG